MEDLLCFDKPKKVRSTEEHDNMFQSDSGVAGTYVPNMSKADTEKWKAKHIRGKDERIEIRKTINGVNLLVIVYKHRKDVKWNEGGLTDLKEYYSRHQDIQMSMNGKLDMTYDNWFDLQQAIREAIEILL